jgi:hypothetical protein
MYIRKILNVEAIDDGYLEKKTFNKNNINYNIGESVNL